MNLPKRRKAQKLGLREPSVIRNASHLAWLRGHECACGPLPTCSSRIEAAHVRCGTDGGTSLKPSDSWAIPLCSWHHATQHRIGEPAFEQEYGIDMKRVAEQLWAKSPHKAKSRPPHRMTDEQAEEAYGVGRGGKRP